MNLSFPCCISACHSMVNLCAQLVLKSSNNCHDIAMTLHAMKCKLMDSGCKSDSDLPIQSPLPFASAMKTVLLHCNTNCQPRPHIGQKSLAENNVFKIVLEIAYILAFLTASFVRQREEKHNKIREEWLEKKRFYSWLERNSFNLPQ